jgi:hypothetical protein
VSAPADLLRPSWVTSSGCDAANSCHPTSSSGLKVGSGFPNRVSTPTRLRLRRPRQFTARLPSKGTSRTWPTAQAADALSPATSRSAAFAVRLYRLPPVPSTEMHPDSRQFLLRALSLPRPGHPRRRFRPDRPVPLRCPLRVCHPPVRPLAGLDPVALSWSLPLQRSPRSWC